MSFNGVLAYPLLPPRIRSIAVRLYGMHIDCGVYAPPGVWVGSKRVTIGESPFVIYGCRFNTTSPISWRALQYRDGRSLHDRHSPSRQSCSACRPKLLGAGPGRQRGLGRDRAVVLLGVVIGDDVVVASGAVAVKDCSQTVCTRVYRRVAFAISILNSLMRRPSVACCAPCRP